MHKRLFQRDAGDHPPPQACTIYSKATAQLTHSRAHARYANTTSCCHSGFGWDAHPIIVDYEMHVVRLPPNQSDLDPACTRMAVDVGDGFLRHAVKCPFDQGIRDLGAAVRLKYGFQAGTPAESLDHLAEGDGDSAILRRGRVKKVRRRPDLGINLMQDVAHFADDRVSLGVVIEAPEPHQRQLEDDKQLA